ncbi:Post-GPI attachment to proteins factor 3 [Cichlidogyrus casuarinus]|uniref:Post-GPI attachment to proteins factor 3 n=1 Tax=Cichlidogyrus casuarinus TaxID=1844966 RepID=A0ABD2QHM3_9PLAT
MLISVVALFYRLHNSRRLKRLFAVCITGFYLAHVYYLSFIKFDYGYNMAVNVLAGVISGMGWILWAQFSQSGISHPHAYLAKWSHVYFLLISLLELLDFPPFYWLFDAHALWHALTIPLPLYFYRFIIHDSLRLDDRYIKRFQ